MELATASPEVSLATNTRRNSVLVAARVVGIFATRTTEQNPLNVRGPGPDHVVLAHRILGGS
jgi:hypothetical protein